ncbi:MAG TPA: acyl-CoA dehydrogenase family protein [Gemmatimonadaceae bacterium]|nr:acyl-CoA dehydrogenase family protein [Gemmatimonadaceae bacterium]
MTEFFQDAPRLGNQFLDDRVLRSYLRRTLSDDVHADVEPGLASLGARAAGDLLALADAAEAQPPRHVPYDAWGRRVDRIETSDAWRALDRVAAEEGIVATAYEREHGALSRVHQLARLYLYHPSSAIYSCPLAMTDGAARAIERHGGDDARLRDAFAHLTSRDPSLFWTSGQWMTERTGGSDVSGTSTVARADGSRGDYRLTGTKWFTSATTSQVAMTLARIEGESGEPATGSAGLSLFYVRLRGDDGELQRIRVNRLKEKLGTRALPTAELTLDGTPAILVGGAGHGVRKIAALLNVTRLYNAVCAVAGMRRAIALAADYATRRVAFGRPLAAHPLHAETLAAMAVEHAGAFHLTFHVGELLGREEVGAASDDDLLLLRLLTPVAKLYTAKQTVAVTSEAIEAFGGAGYVEDTGLPRLLRDAQVLAIWEGTTNVLSLDVLRALAQGDPLRAFAAAVTRRLDALTVPALRRVATRVADAARRIGEHAASVAAEEDAELQQAGARAFAYALARTYTAALLLEHADWAVARRDDGDAATTVALRWCAQELAPLVAPDAAHRAASSALLYGAAQSVGEDSISSRLSSLGNWTG